MPILKTARWILGSAVVLLVVAKLIAGTSIFYLFIPVFLYVFILVYGSIKISAGVFLPVLCKADNSNNEIAITFDDGPVTNTNAILDVLKLNRVSAVFFCIGKRMEENPEVLKRINEEGHVIGNHSYSHHFFFDLYSSKKMLAEMKQTDQIAEDVTGRKIRLFRPPYGVTNPNLAKAIKDGVYYPVGWSVRSMDTVIKEERKLLEVAGKLKSGDIILLHDTAKITVLTLQKLLDEIKKKGFTIVRADKLLNIEPYA
jgi:peptidoglycan/xylan/chitin deacetylase (PgdA/CDA1 family)